LLQLAAAQALTIIHRGPETALTSVERQRQLSLTKRRLSDLNLADLNLAEMNFAEMTVRLRWTRT
jgi:CheY-like chemotaxis protein